MVQSVAVFILPFEHASFVESPGPLVVPKELLVVIEDQLVGELVHQPRQNRLVVLRSVNVEKVHQIDNVDRISRHEPGVEVDVANVVARPLDPGPVEGHLAVKVDPRVDVVVLFPVAAWSPRGAGPLGALSGDRVKVLARMRMRHGRHATLALGGHDHRVRVVCGEFPVVFQEAINGSARCDLVLRNIEGDVAGVGDHHQLVGVNDLEDRSEGLVLVTESVVLEAAAVDGHWEVGVCAPLTKKCQGRRRVVLQRGIRLVNEDMNVVPFGAGEFCSEAR
mmetsp:Transcript_12025/g.34459  ORF Transcript_12025/g.34459 Transcript_12025/m.34459 type:complete len:278 (-) Transcript_12025:325-1158(-)